MSRPENLENLMSVADTVVWAFKTYGFPRCSMTGTRPDNEENITSVEDTVEWAWT